MLLRKDTPLNRLTVYDGLSNWGEIDQGKEVFIRHVRKAHKGVIPKNSCVNQPIWYDWIIFKSEEIEQEYNYSLSELDAYKDG